MEDPNRPTGSGLGGGPGSSSGTGKALQSSASSSAGASQQQAVQPLFNLLGGDAIAAGIVLVLLLLGLMSRSLTRCEC